MKVLVPVDGSEYSMRAVEYARNMAQKHPETKVTLLTVACAELSKAYDFNLLNIEGVYQQCIDTWRPVLDDAKKMFTDAELEVEDIILGGDPATIIVDYVSDQGFDRVIMGSRGQGSIKGLILGSVAYKVLGKVKVPVTIIK
ncbi:MAG: hypothetical protein VR67_13245 [Peptococcaceae bacterium BRH_c8a]|nr:MAG: hypothetical protein VR67_13245 [Peptococcaceae bacterium BRH_c8a]